MSRTIAVRHSSIRPPNRKSTISPCKIKLDIGFADGRFASLAFFVAVAIMGWLFPAVLLAAPTITYVQGNYATPQSTQTSVTVPFTVAQAAGDLNVVVVGWNGTTAKVSSVTDTSGNAYTLAVGPTLISGTLSQSIYYARNISGAAAKANAITVTFSVAAAYPDIRILEYSGADPENPVDVTGASKGSGSTSASSAATTTNATDLIFGANIVTTSTKGPGSGFTRRLITSPDGDIAEDRMTTAVGSYRATAPLSYSGSWIMQMVAFRTPSGGIQPPTAPGNLTATAASTSQINLSWTASSSSIGIANYQVERCQGAGCSNFAQISSPTGATYNDTGLTSNTSYSYRVRAIDTQGNLSSYSNTASATTLGAAASAITYIQSNYATPQSTLASVTIPFTAAQAAGDLNVVVVGWNDSTASVSSVTDTNGNAYTLAVGPTLVDGSLSQSIYYAKSIAPAAAGANSVTVTFSTAAAYPDIRILEYSGADPNNPVDVTAAASGSGSASASSAASTTNANDLIFGANIVTSSTSGPGSGFTRRLITSPDGDIAEDQAVTTSGSYSATAPLGSSGAWIMQMVAFRTPSGTLNNTRMAVNPTSVNFGSVAVGGSSSQVITLSNAGTAAMTVSQAVATGSGFKISGLLLPLTLAAGQSASFSATFSPTTAGNASGSISLASNASNSPLTVALSGTGTLQALSANPASLSFGNVTLGSNSVLPVVVTNTGNTSVTISGAAATGAGFSVSGPAMPLTLAAGQNTSFSVTFAPTAAGSVTGSLSIASNAANSPTGISLSATGVNQHSVTLTWAASDSPSITGYNVYRGTVAGGPYTKLDSSLVSGTNYTDTTVEAGETYYYVTTAVDSQGVESADSNQATAVIPLP